MAKRIKIGNVEIGGKEIIVIAGPCAIESEEQFFTTANAVKKAGAKILRGSAFKPRSSPNSFQGIGIDGLEILQKAKKEFEMPVVSEIMDSSQLKFFEGKVDCIQVGARAMQNFELLKHLAKYRVPVLLKNGLSATLKEFISSSKYITQGSNNNVLFCLRGIRTFETETRFSLDLGLVPILQKLSDFPVVVDPSHAAGKRELVPALAKAAIAAGADALLIEVHPNPETALSDSEQQLNFSEFRKLMQELRPVARAVGREI